MNNTQQSWRELLGSLIQSSSEKQRVADALGVNSFTVARWVSGESTPQRKYFGKLPRLFPEYEELLEELIQAELFPHAHPRIPPIPFIRPDALVEYLVRILATYATTRGPYRAWTIRTLTLQQAIELLDPDHIGMELVIFQCVPPTKGQAVRSLCERRRNGTAPQDTNVGMRILFLGAESLSGTAIGRGEPCVVQDLEQKQRTFSLRASFHKEKSAVAWPIQRAGKIAGCLTAACTQKNYFTSQRLSLIEVYVNALALSFQDEDFYELGDIDLHEMPLLSLQQLDEYSIQFHERVRELRRTHRPRLSEEEAEKLIFQQMEAELLE